MSGNLPEKELQSWFKTVTGRRELTEHIVGEEQLEARARQLNSRRRAMETVTRLGIDKALRICAVLADADHLSADRSVSAPGLPQMRPDIVLTSDSGHYVLIELKTAAAPERQAIQELLAYSATIKMQAPYLNNFMFVIVARQWDTLLEHATRSLIMDGKYVLPLRVVETADSSATSRQFSLHICHEMFEFDFVQCFDPWYALVPAEIVAYRPKFSSSIDKYLERVVREAMYDAIQIQQTGFAMFWEGLRYGASTALGSAVLATVNQHWCEGEGLPEHYPHYYDPRPRGFSGLHQSPTGSQRRQNLLQSEDSDLYALFASQSTSSVYKQSALSYELLDWHRNRGEEIEIGNRWPDARHLELSGSYFHLEMFMRHYERQPMAIRWFSPFGELRDFIHEHNHSYPKVDYELTNLISLFKVYKVGQSDALPDRIPV